MGETCPICNADYVATCMSPCEHVVYKKCRQCKHAWISIDELKRLEDISKAEAKRHIQANQTAKRER